MCRPSRAEARMHWKGGRARCPGVGSGDGGVWRELPQRSGRVGYMCHLGGWGVVGETGKGKLSEAGLAHGGGGGGDCPPWRAMHPWA